MRRALGAVDGGGQPGESEDEIFAKMFRVLRDFPAAREAVSAAFQNNLKIKEISDVEVG